MSITIRPFRPEDHAAARALWEATPGLGLSAADEQAPIEHFLRRNPGLSFVAHRLGVLVGTVLCGHDGRRGLIHHLVVAPAHRRRGVARRLLDAGLRALAAQGIDKAHLLVFRSNAAGLAFWRDAGAAERVELALFSMATPPSEQSGGKDGHAAARGVAEHVEAAPTPPLSAPAARPGPLPCPARARGARREPPLPLAALPNLGPRSGALLAAVGIEDLAALRRLGAVRAFALVRRHDPRASLNLLWALEGALSGLHWTVVAREHRTSLLLALDTLEQGG